MIATNKTNVFVNNTDELQYCDFDTQIHNLFN